MACSGNVDSLFVGMRGLVWSIAGVHRNDGGANAEQPMAVNEVKSRMVFGIVMTGFDVGYVSSTRLSNETKEEESRCNAIIKLSVRDAC